jgi:spore coat polysaccharide biosynthesis predicted glycosyltransferase SpsG
VYIYNQRSENIDFKGLAEVINKLIFNNLHNPPPTKYFDIIINPLYSKHRRKTQCMQSSVNAIKRTGDYKCHIWPHI